MEDVRWRQRFDNLKRAVARFKEALQAVEKEPENKLYKIALIGSFQFCFELSWKTLKDYLDYSGVSASLPREVIKQSFHFQLIDDGQIWIEMLEDRNLMAHVYDEKKAIEASRHIREKYFHAILKVHNFLKTKLV